MPIRSGWSAPERNCQERPGDVITGQLTNTEFVRSVFSNFPTGVTAVAAVVDGRPAGITANSFTSVSLNPVLVSVCISNASNTWPTLVRASHLGVSVLAEQQGAIARRLASREADRFEDIPWTTTESGAVLIPDSAAWFETTIENRVQAGDHEIVVLRVIDLNHDAKRLPLVFHHSTFTKVHQGPTP